MAELLACLSRLWAGHDNQLELFSSRELRFVIGKADVGPSRARVSRSAAVLRVELSTNEIEYWMSFLASCYSVEAVPADHVDLDVVGEDGVEEVITPQISSAVDSLSPDQAAQRIPPPPEG